jgi:penicillin-binding protein 1A
MARRKISKRIEPQLGTPAAGDFTADERPLVEPRPEPGRGKSQKRKAGRKSGRHKERRKRSFLRRSVFGILYWSFAICIWLGIGAVGLVAYFAAELPGASEWRVPDRPPNIQILAVDGTVIGNRGDTGGESVRISELPSYVPSAVISIEDRRFRSHFGVDPVGLVRALTKNFFAGGVVEGGSTLTQQLAKNMFLTPERSLKRKVQEVVLSIWLETTYSKDAILEMYLNRVYFGSGAYGIQAAANRYFNVDARE